MLLSMAGTFVLRIPVALAFAAAANLAVAAGPAPVDKGLRFDSPGVLDLAERSQTVAHGIPVAVAQLAASDDARIFAAPVISEDPPLLRFSDDEYGCAPPSRRCSLEHEGKLIALDRAAVRRDGKRLTITPAGGAADVFVDWNQAATKNAEGDDETHWYLGRLPGSGYQRVEVRFGHDAPGNFLVNPQNGKVAFVHNGADLVAPSPDGKLLVTFNSLNPPLSIRVGALGADGPRLALQCAAPEGKTRLAPVFKGWHGANELDLVIEIGEQGKAMPRLAISLAQRDGAWQLGAGDLQRLESTGLACLQSPSAR
jgi:hypothetical protein